MLDLIKIVAALFAVLIMVFVAECWPQILAELFVVRKAALEEDDLQQEEIARKTTIADAAIAARARGEKFVPPADYDR
ncbi:MAG: hypothetical protein ABIQ32_02155 [Sphingomicrobium sp.]